MRARVFRGERAIRRHLNSASCPVSDPSRDPEGQPDEGAAPLRAFTASPFQSVRPPWSDRVDDLPFCPTCNAEFENGEQTCSCDWTSELAVAA